MGGPDSIIQIILKTIIIMTTVKTILCSLFCAAALPMSAQKQIFIPEALKSQDLASDSSQWSWKRSAQTEDLVFFWEKGFGDDTNNPPRLEGRPMSFDIANLKDRVEGFYKYFRDTLKFSRPGSKADQYKMMVMINYSLEGTAYGGTYDDFIGALWVAPNRIQDRKLNCLAHELGHSFQSQIHADGEGDSWGGSGFFEMASQWMLWQVNPDWLTDENYHFEAFKKLTHKAYLDISNIYHSPYVLEYWSEKHGKPSIAELFRQGRRGEDPVMTYQQLYGMSQQQFNDEMMDCYLHLMNLDYRHAYAETRRYACQFYTPMEPAERKGWVRPVKESTPEDYGFNAIRLSLPATGKKVSARIEPGQIADGGGLRYGFVAVTADGRAVYGTPVAKGKAEMQLPSEQLKALYLVVMGAPAVHEQLGRGDEQPNRQYPYQLKLSDSIRCIDVSAVH